MFKRISAFLLASLLALSLLCACGGSQPTNSPAASSARAASSVPAASGAPANAGTHHPEPNHPNHHT